MLDILSLLGILALSCAVAFEFYYFRKSMENYEREVKHLRAIINKISIDFMIEHMLESGDGEKFRKNIIRLGEKIFNHLKKKYNLPEVSTYMEMKKRILENDTIPQDEKVDIVEFLDDMIYLEYSSRGLTMKKREKMKRTLIKMLRRMGAPQGA